MKPTREFTKVPEVDLSPRALQFAHAFDRLAPDDQVRMSRLIDLLTDERTRDLVESLVLASTSLDDLLRIPGAVRANH